MDNFYEQLLPAEVSSSYRFFSVLASLFSILFFVTLFMSILAPYVGFQYLFMYLLVSCLICAIIAFISFIVKKKSYIEYEYIFTDGIIDIDIIYDKKSRKNLISFEAKDIKIMAEENSDYILDFSEDPKRKEYWYTDDSASENKNYIVIIRNESELIQISFTPDDKFVELCYKYNSENIKKGA